MSSSIFPILESSHLDNVLSKHITSRLLVTLESILGVNLVSSHQPEIELFVECVLRLLPAIISHPTAGQLVSHVKFSSSVSRFARIRTVSMMLFAQYLLKHLHSKRRMNGWDELPRTDIRSHVAVLLDAAFALNSLVRVVVFLKFLRHRNGKPSLSYLLNNTSLEYVRDSGSGHRIELANAITMYTMMHQLIAIVKGIQTAGNWSTFHEYLRGYLREKFTIAGLFVGKIAARIDPHISSLSVTTGLPINKIIDYLLNEAGIPKISTLDFNFDGEIDECSLCRAKPCIHPLRATCKHTFCYVCLQLAMLSQYQGRCPTCYSVLNGGSLA